MSDALTSHSVVNAYDLYAQLLLSLFRIIEPATGTIYIDGVDITKIGLHDRKCFV